MRVRVAGGAVGAVAAALLGVVVLAAGSGPVAAARGSVGVSISVPGAPTSVSWVGRNAEVVVSWSAPVSDGGSAVSSYTVTASPGGQSCSWSSGPSSCTVTGLTNGTAYTFAVTATNTQGTGPPSSPSAPVTPRAQDAALTPTAPVSAASIPCDGPNPAGLVPSQVGDRYDLSPLWEAQHTGQGVRVALIEVGTSIDASVLTRYQECVHTGPVPFFAHQVGLGPLPPPGGESMSDAEMIAGLAPGIDRLDEFFSPGPESMATLLQAALDPNNTGGQRADIVSISFNECESTFAFPAETEAVLAQAAAEGVWVFKGAGDSGSSACAGHGSGCGGDMEPAVDFLAASPYVVATGGIMVTSGDPVTDLGVTWNSGMPKCGATGGGVSTLFGAPSWQQQVPGGLTNAHRMVPDVASIAGDPGYQLLTPNGATYQWAPTEGDSMTGPFYAAGMAALRSDLVADGITPPTLLTPALYAIANNPVLYPKVFRDVLEGNNDLYGVGCCTAGPGYDLTTGLGQVDFANLASALAPAAVTVTPKFTG